MLGLVGTVGGAVALEVRRWRKRGSVEELNEYKRKERELKALLEATTAELEKAKQFGTAAEEKAHEYEVRASTLKDTLEQAKATADQKIAEISQQKQQLQQNNSKLVLSNLMLMNKAKHLEDHSRALVERQENLRHQLEQLQREKEAAESSFETSLAALKDQVTAVLNRYFSKDIDMQQAMAEMVQLGIEVVPVTPDNKSLEFETKLVLDSPHRMQRLMGSRAPQLAGQELPMLSFPMGISKDPATGAPRITLAWRTDPQLQIGASSGGGADTRLTHHDQQQQQQASSTPGALALKDAGSSSNSSSSKACSSPAKKAPQLVEGADGQALSFASPQKQKSKGQTSILPTLSFGGVGGKTSVKSTTSSAAGKLPGGPAPVCQPTLISSAVTDDAFDVASSSRALSKV